MNHSRINQSRIRESIELLRNHGMTEFLQALNLYDKRRSKARLTATLLGSFVAVVLLGAPRAEAVVVISDSFGDADRDNKSGPLQLLDTDINLNETAGDSYEPTQDADADTIFPDGTLVQEVTAVENSADVGIAWYNARGFTSTGDSKPNIKIINDAAGYLPETNGLGPEAIEAIDDGLALAFEQKGRSSPSTAFFGQTIELGPEVGDQVKVSFDFRIWLSAPNYNGFAENHIPSEAELRFGLFEDTDGQLGMTNSVAGFGSTPAVWGDEDGEFRGSAGTVGANGDHGWYVKAPIENPGGFFKPLADGASARIVEELNEEVDDIYGFFSGASDTVAIPNQLDPQFVNLDIHKVYNLALTLERFTDPNSGGTADTILATYTVIERASGQTWELSDYEDVNDPEDGFESDKWDYFGISTGNLDELDWIIDNFQLEIIGSNEPVLDADLDDDGDVDGNDFLLIQSTGAWDLLPLWKADFGTTEATAATVSVPEPSALLLSLTALLGAVGRCRATQRRLVGAVRRA
jgi:hypothetical protein